MGKCETLQFMPAFFSFFGVKLDPWTSFLFRASGKSHLSSGFLPRSLPPQDSVSADALTKFSVTFCSWLKAVSVRGLNSTLPCQIAIIYHVMFLPSLHCPKKTIFARPLSQCLFTLIEAIHLVGQFIMERKHGVNVDLLGPWCAGGLQQESRSPSRVSSSTVRSIWHLPLKVCYRV